MNLELIGQLVSVALIVGAGPIVVAALYVRGGNLGTKNRDFIPSR